MLVRPHEGDEVLGLAQVDDIVRPTGDHVHSLDLLTADFKADLLIRVDVALLDLRMVATDVVHSSIKQFIIHLKGLITFKYEPILVENQPFLNLPITTLRIVFSNNSDSKNRTTREKAKTTTFLIITIFDGSETLAKNRLNSSKPHRITT